MTTDTLITDEMRTAWAQAMPDGLAANNLGLLAAQDGDLDRARTLLEQAVELRPEDGVAWTNLGYVCASAGDLDIAMHALARGSDLQPRDPRPAHTLGRIALARHDFPAAESAFRTALLRLPDNPAILTGLAAAIAGRNRLGAALELLEHAVSLDPELAAAWEQIGAVHYRRGNLGLARDALRRTLVLDPNRASAQHLLVVVYLARGERTAAERELDVLIARNPAVLSYAVDRAALVVRRGSVGRRACTARRCARGRPRERACAAHARRGEGTRWRESSSPAGRVSRRARSGSTRTRRSARSPSARSSSSTTRSRCAGRSRCARLRATRRQSSTAREDVLSVPGPPVETITLTVELDAADQLEDPSHRDQVTPTGLHGALAALELLLYPASAPRLADRAAGAARRRRGPPRRHAAVVLPGPSSPSDATAVVGRRVVPVQLTTLSITEELFDPSLNPIHAKVELGLKVLTYMEFTRESVGRDTFIAHQKHNGGAGGTSGWARDVLQGQPLREGRRGRDDRCARAGHPLQAHALHRPRHRSPGTHVVTDDDRLDRARVLRLRRCRALVADRRRQRRACARATYWTRPAASSLMPGGEPLMATPIAYALKIAAAARPTPR